ncbi:PmoA family protein [Oscillatoria amoena NRMC-F 0135]|nr:DUF6807 family protein [Oscillatoria laete-virens]MDL5050405.1 PmoA family protein [Oscillatoria amoena NRMC-F 0135]MDL5054197.1 PmoA family protein [Oscillatoria laete-virens NRMC-F 0139]
MITLYQNSQDVIFSCGGQVAGLYKYTDAYKPFIHPLNSPRGHCVTVASPYDHKHHKGLMYALREEKMNFWEEFEITPDEKVGRQRHDAFVQMIESGKRAGFVEKLTWLPAAGGAEYFKEERSIFCEYDGTRSAFVWTWKTELTALRSMKLIKSNWSEPLPDGRRINYHGLAVRFGWNFVGSMGWNTLKLNGKIIPMAEGMGASARSVELIGNFDGQHPVPKVSVKMENARGYTVYVRDLPFPFYGLGPTNEHDLLLKEGDRIEDTHTVTVQDM